LAQFDWNGRCLAKIRFRRGDAYQGWSQVFRYSPIGALIGEADSGRGASSYGYDAAHRLVRIERPDGTVDALTHDAAGNLVSAPGLRDAVYDENRLVSANGRSLEYDRRHRVVRDSRGGVDRQYEYDVEDRLSRCRIGRDVLTFRYDALGRRLEKAGPEGTTHFVWDGERLAAEISPTGALRVYVYADEMALTPFAFIDYDDVDSDPASGERRYLYANQIGCPVRVDSDAGQPLWRATIEAYGRTAMHPHNTIELNLRWPGHYYDRETDLHYNRFRYYSPELGRYLQVDPLDIEGGINVYAYPARPLDQVDVDGLQPCPKKPIVAVSAKEKKAFDRAKKKADKIEQKMREAMKKATDAKKAKGENAQALENTTIAVMVVKRKNGQFKIVIASNRNPKKLPPSVRRAADGQPFVGHGDDSPPPVREKNKSHRYSRDKQKRSSKPPERDESTHKHAEQRGLRAVDCDNDSEGVAYIAPTKPCCEGCSNAIQTPHNAKDPASNDKGGWGGDENNVSEHGKKPGAHGDHWPKD
jgi:RHS repeat-associated protein